MKNPPSMVEHRHQAMMENVEFLVSTGCTDLGTLARRVGLKVDTLEAIFARSKRGRPWSTPR